MSRGACAASSSSLMRFGGGGGGGGGEETGGGGGEGGIVAAAAVACALNVSSVLESTPSIVPSSTMGSTSFTSTEMPSAFRAFLAAVSVESSTSASLKNTETSYVVAASARPRRLDVTVAMHAPSELESPAFA